jgi:hypothetical protein
MQLPRHFVRTNLKISKAQSSQDELVKSSETAGGKRLEKSDSEENPCLDVVEH